MPRSVACCRTRSGSAAPTRRSCSSIRTRDAMTQHGGAAQLMQGKRGLIMGVANDHSIAWGIARTLAAHGAMLAFTYQGEALGRRVRPLAQSIGASLVLPCAVEQVSSIDSMFAVIA